MQSQISEVIIIIVVGTILVLLLILFIVSFFFIYQRRQLQNQKEKAILKSQFAQEILKSQIEVQNSTLQQVGQELHDNIGQLLSVAKINLNILEGTLQEEENREYIKQTNEIIGQSIHDLRALTKSLDGDFVQQFGLQESMAYELQRIRKTKRFDTEINVNGEAYTFGYEREIILFRIFQEFLNNSIKHSGAKNISVELTYGQENFSLSLSDDGKGFDFEKLMTQKTLISSGAGLRNIERRCELIGGKCLYETSNGKGTKLNIELPNHHDEINT